MSRFAIIAATVYGNRGAEAMLETAIGRIRDREPGARFVVYSYLPKADTSIVRDHDVTVRSCTPAHLVLVLFPFSVLLALFRMIGLGRLAARIMPAAVRDLHRCSALIDLAGVSFIDGREKFLPFNLLTLWPAMILGVPVFKLSQALGPFGHPLNRIASRTLWHCHMVVPRGEGTLAHLRGARFPEALTYPAPDVAFGWERRDSLSVEGAEEAAGIVSALESARAGGSAVVGLCPSSVIAGKAVIEGWDYFAFMAEIVDGLLAEGHTVVLFPNATRAALPDKLRNNDLPVIARVCERLGAHSGGGRMLAVSGDVSAASIRDIVGACDAVAVSRFHAMVGALAAGVPVSVLGWSHKYAEVMAQFGLDEWVHDYADHDAAAFVARCGELLGRRLEVASAIKRVLPAVSEASVSQFDEIFARLGER